MDMLSKEDLKQIGEVVDEKMDAKFVKFEARMDKKLDEKLDAKFIAFEARIVPEIVKQVSDKVVADVGEMIEENVLPQLDRLENTLVTKSYLDEKLAPIGGKINVLVDVLHRNGTISDDQRRIVHA